MKLKCIVISLIILFVFGCSKSEDDQQFEGTMEAKINGELVIFNSAWGDGSFNMSHDCIEPFHRIFGNWEFNAPDGHLIVLNFYPNQGIGTYNPHAVYITWDGPYNDGNMNVGYNQNHFNVETQTHFEEEGEVTIISTDNNRYKGIFHFTAVNENGKANELGFPEKVIITDGKFEINQRHQKSCD